MLGDGARCSGRGGQVKGKVGGSRVFSVQGDSRDQAASTTAMGQRSAAGAAEAADGYVRLQETVRNFQISCSMANGEAGWKPVGHAVHTCIHGGDPSLLATAVAGGGTLACPCLVSDDAGPKGGSTGGK